MLDKIRPCLLPTAEIRRRSDGTEGIYDAQSGHSFETAPEQANLVQLFDGKRSLLEISAEYMNRYGFVPFAAIDDLMWGLADANLLVDPPESLERLGMLDRSSWAELITPTPRFRWKTRWPTVLRALELLLWPALAVASVSMMPATPLGPLDVLLFYPGLVLALTLRERFKGAVCALAGFAPRRAHLVSALGIIYFWGPDNAVVALADKRARVLAHLGALLGGVTGLLIASPWPGVWAGAAIVLLLDLCPLFESSASSIIGTLIRQANLREHLRLYVGIPLVRDLFSFRVPKADRGLFVAGLYASAWMGLLFFVILGLGLSTGVRLIELGGKESGAMQVLTGVGAMALFAICPVPVLLGVSQFIESAFAVLWPRDTGGRHSSGAADLSAFRSIPLFSKLADADLAAIAAQSREVTYGAGEMIVQEGAPGDTFYSIRSGSVLVARGSSSDRARVIARLGTGDCFGETAMLKDGVRTATVRAATRTVVIELASEAFERMVATVGGVDFAAVLRAASAIGKSKLFKELPAERLSSLASRFVPRMVPAGTDVVKFGDQGHEFFLIAKGQVEVLSGEGKLLTKLGDGDHFGEIALLRSVPRTATVRTTADTLVLVLGRDVFLQALHADLLLSARVEQIAQARATGENKAFVPSEKSS